MAVTIRRATRPVDNFTLIANGFLRDVRLTAEARGTGAYLMSHTAGFELTLPRLAEAMGMGRDRLKRVLDELEEHGYLARERQRGDDGQLGSYILAMTDEPAGPDQCLETNAWSTGAGESTPHKKTNSKKTNENTKTPPEGDGSADAPPAEPEFSAGQVVATYVDAFRAHSGGADPTKRVIAQVGREAKKLLDEGRAPAEVVAAAEALAGTPYATLERQFMMQLAGTPGGGASWGRRGDVDEFGRGPTDATRMSQEAAKYWAAQREEHGTKEPDYTDEYYANQPTGLAF